MKTAMLKKIEYLQNSIVLECVARLSMKSVNNVLESSIDESTVVETTIDLLSRYHGTEDIRELSDRVLESIGSKKDERTVFLSMYLEAADASMQEVNNKDTEDKLKELKKRKKEILDNFDDITDEEDLAEIISERVVKSIKEEKENDDKREEIKDGIEDAIDDDEDSDSDVDDSSSDIDNEDSDDDDDEDSSDDSDEDSDGEETDDEDSDDIEEAYYPRMRTDENGVTHVISDPLVTYIYESVISGSSDEEETAPILVHLMSIVESMRALGAVKDNSLAILERLDLPYLEALDNADKVEANADKEKDQTPNKDAAKTEDEKILMLTKNLKVNAGKMKDEKFADKAMATELKLYNSIKTYILSIGKFSNNTKKAVKMIYEYQKTLVKNPKNVEDRRTLVKGRIDALIPEMKDVKNKHAKAGLTRLYKDNVAMLKKLPAPKKTEDEKVEEAMRGMLMATTILEAKGMPDGIPQHTSMMELAPNVDEVASEIDRLNAEKQRIADIKLANDVITNQVFTDAVKKDVLKAKAAITYVTSLDTLSDDVDDSKYMPTNTEYSTKVDTMNELGERYADELVNVIKMAEKNDVPAVRNIVESLYDVLESVGAIEEHERNRPAFVKDSIVEAYSRAIDSRLDVLREYSENMVSYMESYGDTHNVDISMAHLRDNMIEKLNSKIM